MKKTLALVLVMACALALAVLAIALQPPAAVAKLSTDDSLALHAREPAAGLDTVLAAAGYNGQPGYELPMGGSTSAYMPIAARGSLNTTFFVQNIGDGIAAITVEYYNSDGVRVHAVSDNIPLHGSLNYDQATMDGLPAGFEGGAVISSDQPILAVGNVRPSDADSLLSYNGAQAGAAEVVLPAIMRNFYGHDTDFWVQNAGTTPANVTMTYIPTWPGGNSYVASDIIPPSASHVYRQADIPELGDLFLGVVSITAEQPVVVVAEVWNPAMGDAAAYNGIADADFSVLIPRQQKEVDGWSSSTQIINTGTAGATITSQFYSSDGSPVLTAANTVPPGGDVVHYLPAEPSIPAGFDGALEASADQPLAVLTNWQNPDLVGDGLATSTGISRSQLQSGHPQSGSYQMHLPRVAHLVAEGVSTQFSIQNAAEVTATVTISYYHQSGGATAVVTDAIPPYGVSRYVTEDVGALREDWEGSVTVSADQPIAVAAVQFLHEQLTPTATPTHTPTPTGTFAPSPTPTHTPTPTETFAPSPTPAASATATPTKTVSAIQLYLPRIVKGWPPLPERPTLYAIYNPDGDGNYDVTWEAANRATAYDLAEDDNADFGSPLGMYSTSETSYTITGREPGTYYYRVRGINSYGPGPWSNIESVAVRPPPGPHYYTEIHHWGFGGSGEDQLNHPTDAAVYQNQYVYVADKYNDRIVKFTTSGEFLKAWGSDGSNDGQFSFPMGVSVDSSGNVYVADHFNNRVQKFDGDGRFITKWGSRGSGDGQFKNPANLAISRDGYVYVLDTDNHRVQKFTTDGAFVTKWGHQGSGDGRFYYPYGITVDPWGYVYVADSSNNRIQKFDSNGNFITKWGASGSEPGEFGGPTGVDVDDEGYLYVADWSGRTIQKFDANGNFLAWWGKCAAGEGALQSPWGLALGGDGKVYVTDSWADGVFVYEKRGGAAPACTRSQADSWVVSGSPDVNFGDLSASDDGVGMVVGHFEDAILKDSRALVRFDLSSIPSNATILEGRLGLMLFAVTADDWSPLTIKTYRIKTDWQEMEVTWNNFGGYGEQYGQTSVGADFDSWYWWDETALVQGWINGSFPNYGILLKASASGNHAKYFYTREDASWREPRMLIRYTTPGSLEVREIVITAGRPLSHRPPGPARTNESLVERLKEHQAYR